MAVKIFLPSELFYIKSDCYIFGEIHIADNKSVSYFVTAVDKILFENEGGSGSSISDYKDFRLLGTIRRISRNDKVIKYQDAPLSFRYDFDTPNIYLHALSIKSSSNTDANIFLYDISKILQLHCESIKVTRKIRQQKFDECPKNYNDIQMLFYQLKKCEYQRLGSGKSRSPLHYLLYGFNLLLNILDTFFIILMECKPIAFGVQKTLIYNHYLYWRQVKRSGKQNFNLILDKLLGIFVMFFLLFYISHPGDLLIQTTHTVIGDVRTLLYSLKGSPFGLKLNVHLNNFLLDCFSYHIDLWAGFLNLIEPAVRQLFVPIALLGFMGLSFQLALLSDLIAIIGLHAYCFYTYSAVLYKVEIRGLQVLWKVVLGKRRNLLNNRVESYNYMNRQLYLAIMFFTFLLFLFPTILVYYAVFTALRLCIFLIETILKLKRKQIFEFPVEILIKWLSGRLFEIESLNLEHLEHEEPVCEFESKDVRMNFFLIKVQSPSFSRIFWSGEQVQVEPTEQQTTPSDIIKRILHGTF